MMGNDEIMHVPLESVSSGWAIENWARQVRKQFPDRWGDLKADLTAQEIAAAAQAGNLRCRQVLSLAWTPLAQAISAMIALLCPRRIVIGGGVSLMGEQLLFSLLRKLVADRVFKPFADCYDIVPAALGEEVVIHGALALAKKEPRTK